MNGFYENVPLPFMRFYQFPKDYVMNNNIMNSEEAISRPEYRYAASGSPATAKWIFAFGVIDLMGAGLFTLYSMINDSAQGTIILAVIAIGFFSAVMFFGVARVIEDIYRIRVMAEDLYYARLTTMTEVKTQSGRVAKVQPKLPAWSGLDEDS